MFSFNGNIFGNNNKLFIIILFEILLLFVISTDLNLY